MYKLKIRLKKIHFLLIYTFCCCNPEYTEKKAKYNQFVNDYDSNDKIRAFYKFVKTHNFKIKPGINLFEYFIDTPKKPDYMVQYIPNKKLQQYSIKTIDTQKDFNVINNTGTRDQLDQDEIKEVNQMLVLQGNKYQILVIYRNEIKEINIDTNRKDKVLDLSEYQKNENVKNIYIKEIKEKKT